MKLTVRWGTEVAKDIWNLCNERELVEFPHARLTRANKGHRDQLPSAFLPFIE